MAQVVVPFYQDVMPVFQVVGRTRATPERVGDRDLAGDSDRRPRDSGSARGRVRHVPLRTASWRLDGCVDARLHGARRIAARRTRHLRRRGLHRRPARARVRDTPRARGQREDDRSQRSGSGRVVVRRRNSAWSRALRGRCERDFGAALSGLAVRPAHVHRGTAVRWRHRLRRGARADASRDADRSQPSFYVTNKLTRDAGRTPDRRASPESPASSAAAHAQRAAARSPRRTSAGRRATRR